LQPVISNSRYFWLFLSLARSPHSIFILQYTSFLLEILRFEHLPPLNFSPLLIAFSLMSNLKIYSMEMSFASCLDFDRILPLKLSFKIIFHFPLNYIYQLCIDLIASFHFCIYLWIVMASLFVSNIRSYFGQHWPLSLKYRYIYFYLYWNHFFLNAYHHFLVRN
jgi:hypothetical protein